MPSRIAVFDLSTNDLRRVETFTGEVGAKIYDVIARSPQQMISGKARYMASAISSLALASCISIIAHDEKAAAKSATEFAQVAFVARDYPNAHSLLALRSQSYIPLDKLTETIAKMHPKAFPTKVTATEFEPMPGQRAMNIFVKGEGEGEEFFYRLVMEGDTTAGYRVTGLARGNGPNPSTNKRPLNP